MSSDSTNTSVKTGIYKVTQGEYIDAALFVMEVNQPEESEFTYITVYNPDSGESHEIPLDEWQVIASEDALVWSAPVPDEIKDQYVEGPLSSLDEL